MKNTIIKFALALTTVASMLSPIAVHADQTSNQTTEVIGTFNPVTLNVTIPATTSFTYSSDYVAMTAQSIDVANHSQAPVYMNVEQIAVSATSTWKPSLVAPTSEADWTNLTKAQTASKVSLGIEALSGSSWLNGIEHNNFWSTDLSSSIKVGAIKSFGVASVQPTLKAGTALDSQSILTANYVFEFGIE
jgi:hypothetical protein